jgi:photosystem II stability/assembly factor-like uncharacterized protein
MKIFLNLSAVVLLLYNSLFAQWEWKGEGLPSYMGYYTGINTIGKWGNVLFASDNNRIFRKLANTDTWTEITDKFPSSPRFTVLKGNPSRIFVAFYETINSITYARLFYSTDGGDNWINTGIDRAANITSIAISGNIILAYYQGIFRSTDNGNSWTDLSPQSIPSTGKVIEIVGTDTYLGTDHGLHKSTDYGDSWSQIAGVEGVFSIFNSGSNIYLGASSAVYRSSDNGSSWIKYTNGMPSSVKVQSIYATGNAVLAGFTASAYNYGVSLSANNGENWTTFNEGFPSKRTVNAMVEYDQYVYSAIFAGTLQNGGVYRRPLTDLITDVENDQTNLGEFFLEQNYPNPFNPSTTIEYSIPQAGLVTIKIYDILGKEVATLVSEEKQMGGYTVNFNASNLSSGIYFYRLQAGSFMKTKNMMLIK